MSKSTTKSGCGLKKNSRRCCQKRAACSDSAGGRVVLRRIYQIILSVVWPILVLGSLWMPVPSWGLTLDEAKVQGIVGEQPDGYLGIVAPRASAEAQALVN